MVRINKKALMHLQECGNTYWYLTCHLPLAATPYMTCANLTLVLKIVVGIWALFMLSDLPGILLVHLDLKLTTFFSPLFITLKLRLLSSVLEAQDC